MITRVGVAQNQNTNFRANWTKNAQQVIRDNAQSLFSRDIDAIGQISGHSKSSHIDLDLVHSQAEDAKFDGYDLVASSPAYPNGKKPIVENQSISNIVTILTGGKVEDGIRTDNGLPERPLGGMMEWIDSVLQLEHNNSVVTKNRRLDSIFGAPEAKQGGIGGFPL